MRVAYLVHDLNDAAVARRVAMLRAANAQVRLAGFWRSAAPPAVVSGVRATPLGHTFDARLLARSLTVLGRAAAPAALREHMVGADVVMARNLEMLALAAQACGARRLVYESLDIHRLLLGSGLRSRVLRGLERRLLDRIDLLVVSSPAFLTQYFEARQDYRGRSLLLENKVFRLAGGEPTAPRAPTPRPPWRIGWFGMLRCRRSLAILRALAVSGTGEVQVILRGQPALTEIPDFHQQVAQTPNLAFLGPYSPDDLAANYGQVHFNWTIDYFEEGLNSRWLLPCRIYEGSLYGATPIALADVQAGHWLAERGAGILLADPAKELAPILAAMTPSIYAAHRRAVEAIPRGDLAADRGEAELLAHALASHPRSAAA